MGWPFMFSGRNAQLKYVNSMVRDVPQQQLNVDMMIDVNAAIALLENVVSSNPVQSLKVFLSCFSSSVMAVFTPIIINLLDVCKFIQGQPFFLSSFFYRVHNAGS